jgi:hypothetical protein
VRLYDLALAVSCTRLRGRLAGVVGVENRLLSLRVTLGQGTGEALWPTEGVKVSCATETMGDRLLGLRRPDIASGGIRRMVE